MSEFKGFTPPVKNYYPMPNEWTDITSEIESLAELKLVEYVLRHTWGYHEFGISKTISTDEFMYGRKRNDGSRIDKGTGLRSDRSVKDGLRLAIEHGYLVCDVDYSDHARVKKSYKLKMLSLTGVDSTPLPTNEIKGVVSTPAGGSIYPSGVHLLPIGQVDSTHRSEKDTLERHFRKKPKKDSDALASPTLISYLFDFLFLDDEVARQSMTLVLTADDDQENERRSQLVEDVYWDLKSRNNDLVYKTSFEQPTIESNTTVQADDSYTGVTQVNVIPNGGKEQENVLGDRVAAEHGCSRSLLNSLDTAGHQGRVAVDQKRDPNKQGAPRVSTTRAKPKVELPALTEQQQLFMDLYCALPWIKVRPQLTANERERMVQLAPHFQTKELLYGLHDFMRQKKFFQGKGFTFTLMLMAVNDWASAQEVPLECERLNEMQNDEWWRPQKAASPSVSEEVDVETPEEIARREERFQEAREARRKHLQSRREQVFG